jgi:hypothetical protein
LSICIFDTDKQMYVILERTKLIENDKDAGTINLFNVFPSTLSPATAESIVAVRAET